MKTTYHIRIKKEFAVAIIENLQKMEAIELLNAENGSIPESQNKEVGERAQDDGKNPYTFVDERIVIDMLNGD